MGASDSGQKRSYIFAFLILPLLIISNITGSFAASYVINPTNTNISFGIERFKRSTTTGGFYNVKGNLQYDPSSQTGDISLVIPISSLSTGSKAFNHTLTGPNFFDVQRFPLARFDSTKWYFNQNKSFPKILKVDGNLTLHGETHPISLTATKFDCYLHPAFKKDVCNGNFTATVDRTKWNIDKYAWFGVTKNLNLEIQIEAIKQ
ncbi:polyisoprenoid-binding protein [Psychrobacter glaciei]|uniref:Polyisoprenoid-binding protein n=1 Tax=Psychrobacter glaciei TaxID=619771 RepID=A0ABQ3GSP1_9GAMM|nr:YceI family protein [Psychrobacter glaciei]GHD32784.1 polyisoprenoid-binding protein [Psychrobacter glaciei]